MTGHGREQVLVFVVVAVMLVATAVFLAVKLEPVFTGVRRMFA